MQTDGLDTGEIARRVGHSPDHVQRMLRWAEIDRPRSEMRRYPQALERRVMALLAAGESEEQVAERFRRSPRSIRQIAGFAHLRAGMHMLETAAAGAREVTT